MADKWVEEIDDLYGRNIHPIPIASIRSFSDLVEVMFQQIDKSGKLSPAQKEHAKDNVLIYLAPKLWSEGKNFKKSIFENVIFDLLKDKIPEEKKELFSERIKTFSSDFADYIEHTLKFSFDEMKSKLYKKYGVNQIQWVDILDRAGLIELPKGNLTPLGRQILQGLVFKPTEVKGEKK